MLLSRSVIAWVVLPPLQKQATTKWHKRGELKLNWNKLKCQTEMSNRVVSSCDQPEEGEAELYGCDFVLYRGAGANKVIENTDISSG